MARDEAKVRVRLDTRQAKGELRGLTQDGAKAAGRVGAGIRSAVGRGMGVVGLGAGIGAGLAAVKAPTQGAISSIFTSTFGALGARAERGLTGEEGFKAVGEAKALEEALGDSMIVGHLKRIPAGTRARAAQTRKFGAIEAEGANRILSDPNFRNAAARFLDKKVSQIGELLDAYIDLFTWGFKSLSDKLGR